MNEQVEEIIEEAMEARIKEESQKGNAQKQAGRDYSVALRIAVKIVKQFEGCRLIAYPDPASDLYKALSKNNLLRKWMHGETVFADLSKDLQKLEGKPWTVGYGCTEGVKCGDVWTQEQAEEVLQATVSKFLTNVLKDCPQLQYESDERIAACTSLAYNIGSRRFAESSVCKFTMAKDYGHAADSFLLFNKAGGEVNEGLNNRRKMEKEFYIARSM